MHHRARHKNTCTRSQNQSLSRWMRMKWRFSAAHSFMSSGRDGGGYFGSCSRCLWVHLCSGCERDPFKSVLVCVCVGAWMRTRLGLCVCVCERGGEFISTEQSRAVTMQRYPWSRNHSNGARKARVFNW